MKINESEVSTGSATGKAGIPSLPFGKGYYQSGGSNGEDGIHFTPYSEPELKSYKKAKHSKNELKKMKKFKEFIKEDATTTAGNTCGMGGVVAASPSSTPGDVAGSTIGSGDIGAKIGGAYTKKTGVPIGKNLLKKKKSKSPKNITSFANFNPMKEEIDNFTARYYDDFDDEEEKANEYDLQEFNPKNRKIQLFEAFEDNITYEMSGSPSPYFKTKAEFVKAMQECGYEHTTLTKKTNMLICSTEDLGTLKFKKAQKYGIPIYTYEQAKKEMKNLINVVSKYNL
jgi:hypothetical protein